MAAVAAALMDEDENDFYRKQDSDYVHMIDTNGDGIIDEDDIAEMPDMGRRLLVTSVGNVVDRHDAFESLPATMAYIIIFIFLIWGHLQVYHRSEAERALKNYLNGRDEFSDAENNIDNLDSYWEWLHGEGVYAMFGVSRVSPQSETHYIMANRFTILGDFKVKGTKVDKVSSYNLMSSVTSVAQTSNSSLSSTGVGLVSREVWGLKHQQALDVLKADASKHKEAAEASITALGSEAWWNKDVEKMELSLTAYDKMTKCFARVQFTAEFTYSGFVRQWFTVNAVDVFAWSAIPLFVADGFFFLLWSYIFVMESIDMFRAWRMGCGELFDYFGAWNILDWISIIIGFGLITIQVFLIYFCVSENVLRLIAEDGSLVVAPMSFDTATLDDVNYILDSISFFMNLLEQCMALNTISIVAKFFKGFSSNPRLSLVASTIMSAAYDFVHFSIVLFAIFLPFVMIGHIVFGSDIAAFATLTSSISNSFLVLFGEFFWYLDALELYRIDGLLPSGTPKFFIQLWYLSYEFVVFLVLLNLLLAIIIEHYTKVTAGLKYDPDAVPLWIQIKRYKKFRQETRGHISFAKMRLQLEDDDEPAHPTLAVSHDSLVEAFGMSKEQAEWMMNFLDKELALDMGVKLNHDGDEHDEATEFEGGCMKQALLRAQWTLDKVERMVGSINEEATQSLEAKKSEVAVVEVDKNDKVESNVVCRPKLRRHCCQQTSWVGTYVSDAECQQLVSFMGSMEEQVTKLQRDQARLGKRLDSLINAITKADGNYDVLRELVKAIVEKGK
eukprot:TRINITY_DN40106_c0_g1_i1.p1 TRINITY_DN40106_c0_g1~~TRINITY_DN40106_c0_g1_i1.p1  ORF type:complete len:784 (-),score=131.33 TRINITY_DN40106_c0_g1_i1:21-2372(-)